MTWPWDSLSLYIRVDIPLIGLDIVTILEYIRVTRVESDAPSKLEVCDVAGC